MNTVQHKRVRLSQELDTIHTYNASITKDGKYLLCTQNNDYGFAWIDLSRLTIPPKCDNLNIPCQTSPNNSNTTNATNAINILHTLDEDWVWKHYIDEDVIQGEPISTHIYTTDDKRLYILTADVNPLIYIIHLPTSTLEYCLTTDMEHWTCKGFVDVWPSTGHKMLMVYGMDNTVYSYHLDMLSHLNSKQQTLQSLPTDTTMQNDMNNILSYTIYANSKYCISGWVFRHLPLVVIQGCRVIFHDGYQLCSINLEKQEWERKRSNAISGITMHPGITKRMEVSNDERYIYVLFFNGMISQYRSNKSLDCIAHYSVKLHPFSQTPMPWPEYMDMRYLDEHSSHVEPGVPVINIQPPIESNKYFVGYKILESIADESYGVSTANTWRILNTNMGIVIYKNKLEYIQSLEYIKCDAELIYYRCGDRLITFANLDMPLTPHTYKYFPPLFQNIIMGIYCEDTSDIIKNVSRLPLEIIEIICSYISLSSVYI